MVFNTAFNNIIANRDRQFFFGGGNRSAQRKPPSVVSHWQTLIWRRKKTTAQYVLDTTMIYIHWHILI